MQGPKHEREYYEQASRDQARAASQDPERRAARWRGHLVNAKAGVVALGLIGAVLVVAVLLGSLRLINYGMTRTREMIGPPPEARTAVKQFLHVVDIGDIDRAYELMSTRAKTEVSRSQLKKLMTDPSNLGRFDGYKKLYVERSWILTRIDVNPDFRRHQVTLEGSVVYDNAPDATFRAVVEKEGDEWKILEISVDAPSGQGDDTGHEA